MLKGIERVYANVNLKAVCSNAHRLIERCEKNTKLIAVVKADGYGHGAIPVAKALEDDNYVYGFAVATCCEAMELVSNGIKKPILILGAALPEDIKIAIQNEIRLALYSVESAELIDSVSKSLNKKAIVHVKIDTGMGRIGFFSNEDNLNFLSKILSSKNLYCEGIFTHFSKADERDKAYTKDQICKFNYAIDYLRAKGIEFPYHHCANSAGIIDRQGNGFELVRMGIAMYGMWPSDEVNRDVELLPAFSMYSKIVHIKKISANTAISYGNTFVSEKELAVATIPVGYADGYPRSLSNKGYVLIHGRKCPIIGRICMDQMMVDITNVKEAKLYDKVTLIGTDCEECICAEELGALSGRINYELICDINKRVPRVYI